MNSLFKQTFTANKVRTANDIILEQCFALQKLTNGKVIGMVKEFSLSFKSTEALVKRSNNNYLGEESDNFFHYEFYITSISTPKYIYRVLTLSYGISIYPVQVTLDEAITKEISTKTTNNKYSLNSDVDFVTFLAEVLNSEKFTSLVNALLALNP